MCSDSETATDSDLRQRNRCVRRATSCVSGMELGVEIEQVASCIGGSEEVGALGHVPKHRKVPKIDLFLDIARKQSNFI